MWIAISRTIGKDRKNEWEIEKINSITICSSHWKGSEKMEWSAIYGSCFTLCYILDILLFLCYFGNVLTNSLIEVADCAYDSEWYKYPNKSRAYVAFMIQSAQRPFFISAYGIMPCTIENLLKVRSKFQHLIAKFWRFFFSWKNYFFQVLNTTASAYMVMRKFYWSLRSFFGRCRVLNVASTSWMVSNATNFVTTLKIFALFWSIQIKKLTPSPF